MKVSIVVAASLNNVIGRNNGLPWHLPNDLTFFKNITWGMPVVMGRKTFESMDGPLKGRTNVVISRSPAPSEHPRHVMYVHSLEEGIRAASTTDALEVFVIGGGEIFRQAMPLTNRIYITRVMANVEGDVTFPEIDVKQWERVSERPHPADDRHAYAYSFETWEKKREP